MLMQSKRKSSFFWINAMAPLMSVILGSILVYFTHAEKHGVQVVISLKLVVGGRSRAIGCCNISYRKKFPRYMYSRIFDVNTWRVHLYTYSRNFLRYDMLQQLIAHNHLPLQYYVFTCIMFSFCKVTHLRV